MVCWRTDAPPGSRTLWNPDKTMLSMTNSLAGNGDSLPSLQESHARLRAENERLQLALAASGVVGPWDWTVDTDLLHGDANFARLYGLDPARTAAGVTMEEYQEFVVPDDIPALRADIRDTFECGADFLVEYRLALPGHALRWVECKGRLIADGSGRPVRFSGTAVDITARRALESERDRAPPNCGS